jgi:hypothetical protein
MITDVSKFDFVYIKSGRFKFQMVKDKYSKEGGS